MQTIVEVCRRTRLSSRTIRVWESEGLLKSQRDRSGMRCFDDSIFSEIEKIQFLKDFGFSLKDIAEVLRGKNSASAVELLETRKSEFEIKAIEFARLKRRLSFAQEVLGGCDNTSAVDLFASHDVVLSRHIESLLSLKQLQADEAYRRFLRDELGGLSTEALITWISALKTLRKVASSFGVQTRFVRGAAPSYLALYLLGLTKIDPVKEGLIPQSPQFKRFILMFRIHRTIVSLKSLPS